MPRQGPSSRPLHIHASSPRPAPRSPIHAFDTEKKENQPPSRQGRQRRKIQKNPWRLWRLGGSRSAAGLGALGFGGAGARGDERVFEQARDGHRSDAAG